MANELNDYNFGKMVALVETSIKNDEAIFKDLKDIKEMVNKQNEAIANGRGVIAGLMLAAGGIGAAGIKLIEKIFV